MLRKPKQSIPVDSLGESGRTDNESTVACGRVVVEDDASRYMSPPPLYPIIRTKGIAPVNSMDPISSC